MNWINAFELICYFIVAILLVDIFKKKSYRELGLLVSGALAGFALELLAVRLTDIYHYSNAFYISVGFAPYQFPFFGGLMWGGITVCALRIAQKFSKSKMMTALLSGWLIVSMDLLLDVVAIRLDGGFWVWDGRPINLAINHHMFMSVIWVNFLGYMFEVPSIVYMTLKSWEKNDASREGSVSPNNAASPNSDSSAEGSGSLQGNSSPDVSVSPNNAASPNSNSSAEASTSLQGNPSPEDSQKLHLLRSLLIGCGGILFVGLCSYISLFLNKITDEWFAFFAFLAIWVFVFIKLLASLICQDKNLTLSHPKDWTVIIFWFSLYSYCIAGLIQLGIVAAAPLFGAFACLLFVMTMALAFVDVREN